MENTVNESQNKIHALEEMLSKEMMVNSDVQYCLLQSVDFSQY